MGEVMGQLAAKLPPWGTRCIMRMRRACNARGVAALMCAWRARWLLLPIPA